MEDINGLVSDLKDMIVTAGKYALAVQSRVENVEKEGTSPINRALTDADLSIENLFEVFLLSAYPDISFRGEEVEESRNASYFAADADVLVTCDPINGTLNYANGSPHFEVIVTVFVKGIMTVVLMYKPRIDLLHIAVKGFGVRMAHAGHTRMLTLGTLSGAFSEKKLWTTKARAPVRQILARKGYELVDCSVVAKQQPWQDPGCIPSCILTGNIAGFFRKRPQVIDDVATAFVAQLSGAVVLDLEGAPINFDTDPLGRIPSIVCATSEEVAELICRVHG